jgi:iron complex transport system substrate-binding protein
VAVSGPLHRVSIPLVAVAVALAGGCDRAPSRGSIALYDDWGRRVELAAPTRRVVSLAPATTELVFALGLGDRLVGRTRWCDYPAETRGVADVGDGILPNVEAVAARQPDLVLLYASDANRSALGRLHALGIPVLVLRVDLADDVRRAARLIAAAGGAPGTGDSLVAALDSALAEVSAADSGSRRPRVYIDVEPDPPLTIGRGSYLSQILDAAGADNVFGDIVAPSAPVSLEAIVARDPDAVLVLSYDTIRPPDLAARPGWRAVRAVRERKVVVVDGRLFGRPSPRMPLAVRDLARRLRSLPPRP